MTPMAHARDLNLKRQQVYLSQGDRFFDHAISYPSKPIEAWTGGFAREVAGSTATRAASGPGGWQVDPKTPWGFQSVPETIWKSVA